jgi:hypothetical protein
MDEAPVKKKKKKKKIWEHDSVGPCLFMQE